jgi:hypothetical protein
MRWTVRMVIVLMFWLPPLALLALVILDVRATAAIVVLLIVTVAVWTSAVARRPRPRVHSASVSTPQGEGESGAGTPDDDSGVFGPNHKAVTGLLSYLSNLDASGWQLLEEALRTNDRYDPLGWLRPEIRAQRAARKMLNALRVSGERRESLRSVDRALRQIAAAAPASPLAADLANVDRGGDIARNARLPPAPSVLLGIEDACAALVFVDLLPEAYGLLLRLPPITQV